MRVALDSNILVYFVGIAQVRADEAKVECVRQIYDLLRAGAIVVTPVQALGELFVVSRRHGFTAEEATTAVQKFASACETPASDVDAVTRAMKLVAEHRLQYWDAVILSAAARAGCTMLLSEDMQHGFAAGGVTVVNPLAEPMHPQLAAVCGRG